ncbi:IMP dehydrogenase family protein [Tepidimonas alkaliphilus]|uniref:IMP dehydrogenase family protein n=1 Tax=Tepidimonas alkaliphilus TaxID=2588942 RepID=A0A554W4H1_9BURK|nr:CBS domain-containing protein [Tepidimonas alkaliphilus]TSE18475.1 IMP dehydrogenase family protein [Tepidimonas alkaliphilus]
MLAIYGPTGLLYRGAIEDWRRVWPALASSSAQALSVPVNAAGRGPQRGDRLAQSNSSSAPARPRTLVTALHAYDEAQHPPTDRHPLQRVHDVMSRAVTTVSDRQPVSEAWQRLAQHGFGQAPVLNADGALVGLLTRAELLRADRLPRPDDHPLVWRAFLAQPVAAVMVSPVPAVEPPTLLRRLALLLLETGLPGVPVVQADGALAGFVSRTDVLKAVVHDPPLDLWAG